MKKKHKKFLIPALAAALTIGMGTAIALAGGGKLGEAIFSARQSGANGENVGGAQSETQSGFIPVASLFSAENGVSVKSNQTTPSYVEEARNGVAVRSKNAKKVKYEKPIDISDNTKEDLLFEMQITPEESGSVELKQFLIRFEDWNNPGCYFEISLVNYPWGQSGLGVVSVKTNTVSQYRGTSYKIASKKDGDKVNYEVSSSNTTDAQHGTTPECAFDGRNAINNHSVSNTVKFYYDNAEKAVYVGNVYDWSGALAEKGYSENGRIKVLDMDLQADMGSTKSAIWEGFEGDFVRLSVETAEMEADFANYMILTIDNQTMAGSIVKDTAPPKIEVDIDEENIPYGVAGQAFYFADAYCYDEMYENNTSIVKKVYSGGEEIGCSDRGFIPTRTGKYTIEYLGFDYVGNCAKKTVEIEVLAAAKPVSIVFDEQSVADGAIRLDKTRPASADLFAKTKLPEAAATGVSGTAEKEISVKFGGEYVSVEDGAFIPFAEGIYTATYKFSDALKNVYLFDYEIEVSFTGKAVLTPVALEKYMLDGSRYKLPAVSYSLANRFGEKIGTAETYIKICNKDTGETLKKYGGGSDELFIPERARGERVEIVYGAQYDGQISEAKYDVTILKSECLADRFVADEGVTRTIEDYALKYSATEDKKGFSFVNRVLLDELSLRFAIPAAENNFEKLNIYINSFEAKNESVKLTLLKNPDETAMVTNVYANGAYLGQCRGNFHETAPMDFVLSFDGTRVYDSNDDLIGRLSGTQSGKPLAGFTGRYVEIRFEFEGVTGAAAISFTYINNQMTGDFSNNADYMSPGIYADGEIGTKLGLGGRLTIPRVYVYDVFDSLPEITVEITDENGGVCFEKKFLFGKTEEIVYAFAAYGEYMLNITAKDASGNAYTYMGGISVSVTYNVKPIIHIAGEIRSEARVNERVELPEITVYDIKDGVIGYDAYVCAPDGSLTKIEKAFIPVSKGVYSIFISAMNSSGNVAVSETFVIRVY